MLKSPLIQTLQLLSQEEFETLHLFVASPLFNEVNRYHDTISLFDYLRPFYPEFTHADLQKEIAGSKLFPERKNPKSEVEKAMSHLMRVVRQFITFQQFAVKGVRTPRSAREEIYQNPISLLNFARQQLALMRFYSDRMHQKPLTQASNEGDTQEIQASEHYFLNLYEKLKKELGAVQDFSGFEEYERSDFFYFGFLLEQEKALFDSLEHKRDGNRNLLTAMESLDRYYLVTKLDMLIRIMHQMKMAIPFSKDSEEMNRFVTNRDITLQLVHSLAAENYLQSPVIVLYCTLLECLTNEDPDSADQAADRFYVLINEGRHLVPATTRQDFKVMLRSYWARRYRQTREMRFSEKVFLMQMEQLRDLSTEEPIPSSQMHNILATAIKLRKADEAEGILDAMQYRIVGTSNPEIVRNLWWAMLRYEQGRVSEARSVLPHYYVYGDLDDIIFYASAATLDVKICYDLDTLDEDQHNNMVRATSARIVRDKALTPEARQERERFFPLAMRLFKLKQKIRLKKGNHGKDLDTIRHDIQEAPVVHKEWLLEKCGEVETQIKIESK
jgi:hypothetical protein